MTTEQFINQKLNIPFRIGDYVYAGGFPSPGTIVNINPNGTYKVHLIMMAGNPIVYSDLDFPADALRHVDTDIRPKFRVHDTVHLRETQFNPYIPEFMLGEIVGISRPFTGGRLGGMFMYDVHFQGTLGISSKNMIIAEKDLLLAASALYDVKNATKDIKKETKSMRVEMPKIKKVHFSGPVTCVIWDDKTKTIVRCSENDIYDPEKGLAMAIVKRLCGNGNGHKKLMKKFVPEEEEHIMTGDDLFKLMQLMDQKALELGFAVDGGNE